MQIHRLDTALLMSLSLEAVQLLRSHEFDVLANLFG